jgi:riboflavin biosynthesis pyrimidine reductase
VEAVPAPSELLPRARAFGERALVPRGPVLGGRFLRARALDELVVYTAAEILAVKGIGAKSLDAIRATLADRGLTLADAAASGVDIEHMAGVAS